MCSTMSDDERSGDYPYRNRAIGSGVGGGDREHRSAGEQCAAAKVWYVAIDVERFEIPTFLCPSRRPVHFLLGEHQPDRIGGSNQRPLQREKTVPGGRCGIRNITHKEYQS